MLSIIVTHYRSPELLRLCLGYYRKHAPAGSEIIVSDSATTRETEELMADEFGDLVFLAHRANVGYARLVNDALKIARGETFLISNADVLVTDGHAITQLLDDLAQDAQVGMVGPRLLHMDGTHQYSCFRFYRPLTFLARRTRFGRTRWGRRELERFLMRSRIGALEGGDPQAAGAPFAVDWLMGSVILVRRRAVEDAGPLDERYFLYMEDVDWCRAFWELGWRVMYDPRAAFYHYHGKASKKRGALRDLLFNKYARTHLKSAIKYFLKYGTNVPRYGV